MHTLYTWNCRGFKSPYATFKIQRRWRFIGGRWRASMIIRPGDDDDDAPEVYEYRVLYRGKCLYGVWWVNSPLRPWRSHTDTHLRGVTFSERLRVGVVCVCWDLGRVRGSVFFFWRFDFWFVVVVEAVISNCGIGLYSLCYIIYTI